MDGEMSAPVPVTAYVPWCKSRRLNPHHPEDWPDAVWEEYVEALRVIVKPEEEPDPEDWVAWRDRRMWPPPRRSPWKRCPCHKAFEPLRDELGYPYWPRTNPADDPEHVPDEEIAAWVAADPAARAFTSPTAQKALTFIERFRPKDFRPMRGAS